MAELFEVKKRINEDAIRILENWLEDVKTGRVVSVVIAGRVADGTFQHSSSNTNNRIEDAGMLIKLAMRMLGFEAPSIPRYPSEPR